MLAFASHTLRLLCRDFFQVSMLFTDFLLWGNDDGVLSFDFLSLLQPQTLFFLLSKYLHTKHSVT